MKRFFFSASTRMAKHIETRAKALGMKSSQFIIMLIAQDMQNNPSGK